MTRLEKELRNFQEKGLSEEERIEIKKNNAPDSFKRIAKELLSGYFEVSSGNNKVKVYPTTIEFYYHEEDRDIKDFIVYHRNTKSAEKDPFPFGILHNHVSGIDITFEKKDSEGHIIRASALIREYRVDGKGIDTHSTYLYNDLYSNFSIFDGFSIIWRDSEIVSVSEPNVRKNVAKYDETTEKKIPATESTTSKITLNKKHVQCPRRWQFKKE